MTSGKSRSSDICERSILLCDGARSFPSVQIIRNLGGIYDLSQTRFLASGYEEVDKQTLDLRSYLIKKG
jgi:hypothetical protein